MDALKDVYVPFSEGQVNGLEDFDPEQFIPASGNIIVVTPPPITQTKGGVHLPDTAVERPCIGRVAAVPRGDFECPFDKGDLVIFRAMSGQIMPFRNRTDILLLQYTGGPDSEVLGKCLPG